MIQLYQSISYPDEKQAVAGKSIVDILTSDKPTSVEESYFDAELQKQKTRHFAINYGLRKSGRFSGFVSTMCNGELEIVHEIDTENKRIWSTESRLSASGLFRDSDKVEPRNQYVFEGTLEDVLGEFKRKGYKIIKKRF